MSKCQIHRLPIRKSGARRLSMTSIHDILYILRIRRKRQREAEQNNPE